MICLTNEENSKFKFLFDPDGSMYGRGATVLRERTDNVLLNMPAPAVAKRVAPAAAAPCAFASYVAVVDMRSSGAAEAFTRSLKETGFAVCTGHGLDYRLVKQVYAEWRELFLSGAADQARYLRDLVTQDGFFDINAAESAKGVEVKDLKQYYQLYFPHGRYPSEVSDAARRLFAALIELGAKLLTWIDEVRKAGKAGATLFV
jgi:hypothetical protein